MVIVDVSASVGIPSLDKQHTVIVCHVIRDQLFQALSMFFVQGRSLCYEEYTGTVVLFPGLYHLHTLLYTFGNIYKYPWMNGCELLCIPSLTFLESITKVPDRQVAKTGKSSIF